MFFFSFFFVHKNWTRYTKKKVIQSTRFPVQLNQFWHTFKEGKTIHSVCVWAFFEEHINKNLVVIFITIFGLPLFQIHCKSFIFVLLRHDMLISVRFSLFKLIYLYKLKLWLLNLAKYAQMIKCKNVIQYALH